ncbi:coth protein-domain-containing protein [Pilobolus umbonatus]|nr:coth protein-domain-containing protein [Pilobolus umbonatus]
MRLLTLSALITTVLSGVLAADVQYSVVAFPSGTQGVAVVVGGQNVPLEKSATSPNIFTGLAPYGATYQYALTEGQTATPESTTRNLAEGVTATGNEFFNRSRTVYNVPGIPQAYNPFYPTLFTNFNKSDEIATLLLTVNATALDGFNKNPLEDQEDALVSSMTYISNKDVYQFSNAGLATSGQSTKDFAKQSWAIDLNAYVPKGTGKNRLYGRTAIKLRAHETDSTLAREKLVLDMLAAAGGATLSGSWVRVFINGEGYGLFLMTDDISTTLVNNILHGGNWKYPNTGVTYKGNALSPEQEGNLVYLGEDPALYPDFLYKLSDTGEDKTVSKKNNTQVRIIELIKRISEVNPADATDDQNLGSISKIFEPRHTLVHTAMSFLIGSWDGFWYQASNYYLIEDMATKIWTLVTYDFDESYGGGLEDWAMATVAYTNYSRPGSKRPMVEAFLQNPYYDGVFQDILKTLVKRFFKPSVIKPRLDAWNEMLKEDIAWSRAIPGKSTGITTSYTVADLTSGLIGGNEGILSINDWITKRAAALTTQLNFSDVDDLPALPAYTDASFLDAQGNVVNGKGDILSESGTTGGTDGGSGASSIGSQSVGVTLAITLVVLLVSL